MNWYPGNLQSRQALRKCTIHRHFLTESLDELCQQNIQGIREVRERVPARPWNPRRRCAPRRPLWEQIRSKMPWAGRKGTHTANTVLKLDQPLDKQQLNISIECQRQVQRAPPPYSPLPSIVRLFKVFFSTNGTRVMIQHLFLHGIIFTIIIIIVVIS